MQRRSTVWLGSVAAWGVALLVCPPSAAIELRLPAIDPTGNRIFLPFPASTTLNLDKDRAATTPAPPAERRGLFDKDKEWFSNLWPRPAYQTPPSIPLCGSPQDGLTVPLPREEAPEIKQKSLIPRDKLLSKLLPPPSGWLDDAQLQIAPVRTVARVGSEVILVGGVCTDPGVLIRGEVVEWYLDPGSVGQFTDGGSQFFGTLHNLVHGRATYVEPDYVLSLGAPGPRVLTRGTTTNTDDILLEPGQAWVSLYSDRPGTSYVVGFAPRLPECEEQEVRAVVHWVEGEWVFPEPVVARAGTTQSLTTIVRSYQTGEPLGGWTVRYDILSGPGTFTGSDNKTSTVVTGADGLATVQVQGPPDLSGISRVRIAVSQPNSVGSRPLVVGQGDTTIDWNAAQLDLRIDGPPTAHLDEDITYTVTIRNLGTSATAPLTLIDDLPPELQWLDSDTLSTAGGQRQTWQIESIPPQGMKQIQIRARTNRTGKINHCVSLLNTEGGPRESCISTVVDASSLELQVTGNTQASLGERTTFHIEMLNRSNADVRGLRLRAEFDRGLEHYDPALAGPATNSERGILERTMDQVIPAGGSLPVDITFTTTASGQQCVRVRAESVGAAASDQACVQVQDTPPLPQSALQLRPIGTELTTPLRVGDRRRYDIVFVNTGISPLTDVTIDVEADGAMEISDSSIGYERTDFGLVWRIPRLEPGQRSTHQVEIRAESPSTQACLQVTATSRERTAEQHRDCPPIYGPGGTFPDRGGAVPSPSDSDLFDRPTPGPGEESRGANTLKLEFRTLSSNVVVNRPTNLYVRLINDAIYDIQDVQIRLRLSPGLELIDASGQGLGYRPSPDGRTITFDNILTIRPRDQITVEIRVRPVSVGQVSATVEVEGEQLIQPLEQQQQLTVTN